MGKFTARFTQQLGPLPVWAWAAIALLAILGYMYVKHVGLFGSGSSTPATGSGTSPTAPNANGLSSLLGTVGLMPDPAADASTGLAGGGGTGPPGPGTNSGAFGPTITSYDPNAGGTPDRGGSVAPGPVQVAPVTLASLGVLSPGQNFEPNYAATAQSPTAQSSYQYIPQAALRNTFQAISTGIQSTSALSQRFNPVRARSSGTQAL